MPRPTKAIRRIKLNAAEEYKRGDKKKAYEQWEKAAAQRKEHTDKKRKRGQFAPGAQESSEGESTGEAAS
ncbi:MAG: hypothetical protein J5J06_03785 [Phycisphaerae bacterium]|nr:hypothetical protein [Phycisphaerae bacterium]